MAEQFTNKAQTTLNGGINNSTTSIVVTSATGFPSAGNFRIIVKAEGANTDEIMTVTAVSGTTYTVTRASEAVAGVQAASAHASGAIVKHVLTAASLSANLDGAWTSYTPTLTATVTNPTVVNGTLVGAYKLIGTKTCAFRVAYARGSSDTAGSGSWRVALPFTSGGRQIAAFSVIDSGTSYYVGIAQISSGSATTGDLNVAQAPNTNSTAGATTITHNSPFTWATNDELIISGIIELQ